MSTPEFDPDQPLHRQAAPRSHGSPVDLPAGDEEGEMWYLPDWSERLKLLGWRLILFVPAGVCLVFVVVTMVVGRWRDVFTVLFWWKPLSVVIALPAVMALAATGKALRLRKDPFCIHCGYSLISLAPGGRCPECGRHFELDLVEEYRRDPHWFIERYRSRHSIPKAAAPFAAGEHRKKRRDGT